MSFLGKALKNPLTYVLPAASLLHTKKKMDNQKIDDQMQDPGAAPDMLNANSMPGQTSGLSAYGQMRRQLNTSDAMQAGEQAQAGAMGDTAQARSTLAARGGLGGGASLHLAAKGMDNANEARQGNAYSLMRANQGSDAQDLGNQQQWAQKATLQNQQMQGELYAGKQMANSTLNANRPKGLLGMGMFGL